MFEDLRRVTIGSLSSEVEVLPADYPASKLIGVMFDRGVDDIFVRSRDKVGLVSMRNLLAVRDIANQSASSLATSVPKLTPKVTVDEAARQMASIRVRALPIFEKNRVAGQITASSIIEEMMTRGLQRIRAKDIMTPKPVTVLKLDPARKASSIMRQKQFDHLPVVEQKHLLGMVTSRKIVSYMLPSGSVGKGAIGAEMERRLDYPVERIMDTDPLSCNVGDDGRKVFEEIKRRKQTYTVVKLWDEVQGIITPRDFVKILTETKSEEQVPVYIVGLPENPFEAEAAKLKFLRVVDTMTKSFPRVLQARSVIKTKDGRGDRQRYEVSVTFATPRRNFSYTEEGWDLAATYDAIVNKLKRVISQKHTRKATRSVRTAGEETF
ncbi:MAG: CBS domain-containing protein [Thaumarchaeota archaeon]|nr:CBS domain-containing protein [Nitrososphaerota archaeon]